MKAFLALAFLFALTLTSNVYAKPKDKSPEIKAFISLLDPQHMDTVRVDLSQSTTPQGHITSNLIDFGDGFTSTLENVIHKYQVPGVYTITATVWNNKNLSDTLQKQIEVNADLTVSEIAGPSVFSNANMVNNRNYNFNLTNTQATKLYLLTLTHASTLNAAQNALVAILNLLGIQNNLNTFTANVSLNDMSLFAANEITFNTTSIQRLVYLQNTNQISTSFSSPNNNQVGISMKEVVIIRDTTAPVIALDIDSNTTTNFRFRLFEITDASSTMTIYHVNNDPDTQTSEKTDLAVALHEGPNTIFIQSTDSFGNVGTLNVTNVILDSQAPSLVSSSPASGETLYTNAFPKNYNFFATFNEKLDSLSVNGHPANLSADGKSGSVSLQLSSAGAQNLQIIATDTAGNQATINHSINVIFSNTPPVINLGLNDGFISNSSNLTLPITTNSSIPVTLHVFINGVDYGTYTDTNFQLPISNLPEGTNIISVTSVDAAGNVGTPATISVLVDTIQPALTSISPVSGQTFYTNHLPLSIPVTASFGEVIASANIPGAVTILTSPNTVTSTVQITDAGTTTISITVTDLAGNVTTITQTINVEYSTALPHLTIAPSVIDLLTNQTSIPVSGTSDQVLTSITLNGSPISISPNGLSFSGTFSPPQDGRYELIFSGTDRYGNVGTASTHVRILQSLPPSLVNIAPPTLINNYPVGYQVDYGNQYTPDACAALDAAFGSSDEFSDNLQQVISVDPSAYTNRFPSDYNINVADASAIENFIGDQDERLNYIKAGYLAMCRGINIMPDSDCASNRRLFRLIMGQYPEPMIIEKIPALPISVKNFLTGRLNICTGFDDSNLSCKDLIEVLPLISNFVIPGLGELLGSPAGQFVMDQAICKDKCSQPIVKDSPLCTDLILPEIPQIPMSPTNISFTPPLPGNVTVGIGDWSGSTSSISGNGSGNSCGGFFSSCGGGGSGYLCTAFPKLAFCGNNTGVTNFPNYTTVDLDNQFNCSTVSTFGDMLNLSDNSNVPFTSVLSSVAANCFTTPFIGFPRTAKPIITVFEPIQNQSGDVATIRVRGYVDTIGSKIRINGVDTTSWLSKTGENFDAVITTPSNGLIKVEAADTWGNLADPAEITLAVSSSNELMNQLITSGQTHSCAIINGAAKCWGSNNLGQLGNGSLVASSTMVQVQGILADATAISASYSNFTCAIVNSGVKCWGLNQFGSLGNGELNFSSVATPTPVDVINLNENIIQITSGLFHTCALTETGTVKCWGFNQFGLGDGASQFSATPVSVVNLEAPAKAIGAGLNHTCAVLENNTIKCWGRNVNGQLGDGTNINSTIPVFVLGTFGGQTFTIDGNSGSTCVQSETDLKCWGSNSSLGLLGNGSLIDSNSPTDVINISGQKIKSLTSGRLHSCVVDSVGLMCWGNNSVNQLGNDAYTPGTAENGPVQNIVLDSNAEISSISAGADRTCMITSSGVFCLGSGYGVVPVKIEE